jgi:proline iminopeptidase
MSAGVTAFWIGTGISAALLGAYAVRPATTPPILGPDGQKAEGSVAEIVRLEVNGAEQFLILRGRDASKPVLLFLHGGPGTPETPFIRRWNPGMEDHVVLAIWEQRGAGKSFSLCLGRLPGLHRHLPDLPRPAGSGRDP